MPRTPPRTYFSFIGLHGSSGRKMLREIGLRKSLAANVRAVV
jgi:hypothetical protein